MKTATLLILSILSWSAWGIAGELPYEVTQLIQKRERAVSQIDKRFSEELESLKIKYTKQGNLSAANAVARLLGEQDAKQDQAKDPIVGDWDFFYQGKKRKYRFKEDGTFAGEFPVSGNAFSGTWKVNGTKILLETNGGKERFATIVIRESGEADFRNKGYEMVGKRTK